MWFRVLRRYAIPLHVHILLLEVGVADQGHEDGVVPDGGAVKPSLLIHMLLLICLQTLIVLCGQAGDEDRNTTVTYIARQHRPCSPLQQEVNGNTTTKLSMTARHRKRQ